MGHSAGAINIPISELGIRAPFDLDSSKQQQVDCSYFPKTLCDSALNTLRQAGFQAVGVNSGSVVQ